MGDAMGAHHRQRRIEAPLHERRDLAERAFREHGVESRVDAPIELRPVGSEVEPGPFARLKRRRRPRAQERSERALGGGQNLERAHNPLPVAGVEARSGLGIARLKLGMEFGARAPLGLGPRSWPARLRARRGTSDRPSVSARR